MKSRIVFAGVILVGALSTLAYLLASGKPLRHEIIYLAVLAGFVISDPSFWPRQKS